MVGYTNNGPPRTLPRGSYVRDISDAHPRHVTGLPFILPLVVLIFALVAFVLVLVVVVVSSWLSSPPFPAPLCAPLAVLTLVHLVLVLVAVVAVVICMVALFYLLLEVLIMVLPVVFISVLLPSASGLLHREPVQQSQYLIVFLFLLPAFNLEHDTTTQDKGGTLSGQAGQVAGSGGALSPFLLDLVL